MENFHTTQKMQQQQQQQDNDKDQTTSPKRLYSTEEWKVAMMRLKEDGFVVLPGVTAEQAKHYENGVFDWFEGFSDSIKQDDPKTWTGKGKPDSIHGIFKHYGVGHIQPIWDAREAVAPIFEDYWNTSNLITSFDGVCLLRPGMGFDESKADWIHTDQGAKLRVTKGIMNQILPHCEKQLLCKFRCVQGILNLVDCGPEDGGLYVAKGSHKKHAQFFKDTDQSDYKENWYKYLSPAKGSEEPEEEYKKRCQAGKDYLAQFEKVKVCAKAGDFILFYSTLAHCAVPTAKEGKTHRLAFYISMLPKSFATDSELKRRRKALEALRTTSHWACISFKMNSEFPRTYGAEEDDKIMVYPLDKLKIPKLSIKMLSLAGLDTTKETAVEIKGLRVKPLAKKRKDLHSDKEDASSDKEEEEKKTEKKKKTTKKEKEPQKK